MKSSEYMWCVTPNVNCNMHPNHKFLFLDTTETLAPSPVLANLNNTQYAIYTFPSFLTFKKTHGNDSNGPPSNEGY